MHNTSSLAICLTSLLVAGKAWSTSLQDGTYDAYDCAVPVSDQRLVLKGDHIAFYESACELSDPHSLRGMEGPILFDADCEGEGETWATRFILLQTADGGLMLMGEEWGDRYQRCK
jgi:hypothetical protein